MNELHARRATIAVLAVILFSTLGACSTQQAYYGGQAWQRNECINIIDAKERERCIAATTRLSFQDYRALAREPAGCSGSGH